MVVRLCGCILDQNAAIALGCNRKKPGSAQTFSQQFVEVIRRGRTEAGGNLPLVGNAACNPHSRLLISSLSSPLLNTLDCEAKLLADLVVGLLYRSETRV